MSHSRYRFAFAEPVPAELNVLHVASPVPEGAPRAAEAAHACPMLLPQEPRLKPRDEAVHLLHAAAEVEHSLLVQYLYAAYSLNPQSADLTPDQQAAVKE